MFLALVEVLNDRNLSASNPINKSNSILFVKQGIKLKMDDSGNILARRYSKSNIFVKGAGGSPNEETAIGSEILKSPNHTLELEKVMKVGKDDKPLELTNENSIFRFST